MLLVSLGAGRAMHEHFALTDPLPQPLKKHHAQRDNEHFHTSCPHSRLQTFYVMCAYLFPSFEPCISPVSLQGTVGSNHGCKCSNFFPSWNQTYCMHKMYLHTLHMQGVGITETQYNAK